MDRLKVLFRGQPKVQKKFIRDTKGRPYYLTGQSLMQKYPRAFVLTFASLSTFIVFSGVIYNSFIVDHSKSDPSVFLWPSECDTGVTKLERIRMAYPRKPKEINDQQ